ncbi:MAG: YbaK/EbsC family protein [Acidimicrobiia bacterium]|nr:YbaK/EbsC family protein [Acidimicrobiia bacterium]
MPESTPALEALQHTAIPHEVVRTGRAASLAEAAQMRGVEVRALLKTLVVRRGDDDYVFVLVPGDRVIDWPKLRALLEVRRLSLPDAGEALEATGYERGTITPFGSSRPWPVIADATISELDEVSLGGGAHGVSVKLAAADLLRAVAATIADVTTSS